MTAFLTYPEDCSSPNPASEYILVVAIEIGRNCGYGFSYRSHKQDIRVYSGWGREDGVSPAYSTPTCLLTDKTGNLEAFGYEAQSRYTSMSTEEARGFSYFERFDRLLRNKVFIS